MVHLNVIRHVRLIARQNFLFLWVKRCLYPCVCSASLLSPLYVHVNDDLCVEQMCVVRACSAS
jgi:hypothetical protein